MGGALSSRCKVAVAGVTACLALAGCTHSGQAVRPRPGSAPSAATTVTTAPVMPVPSTSTTTAPAESDTCEGGSAGFSVPGATTTLPPAASWSQQTIVA